MPGPIWWCTPPGSDSQREPRSCSPSKQASARRAARECVTQRILQADTWGVGPRQIEYLLVPAQNAQPYASADSPVRVRGTPCDPVLNRARQAGSAAGTDLDDFDHRPGAVGVRWVRRSGRPGCPRRGNPAGLWLKPAGGRRAVPGKQWRALAPVVYGRWGRPGKEKSTAFDARLPVNRGLGVVVNAVACWLAV
jgi:hypothetical protein